MNLLRPLDHHLVVDGRRLHVLDWGGDDRTPLLLLHGFTGHAHAWDTLSIALQPHFHVYALDQRGHGESDPADIYTAVAAFDDISGVVDRLGLTSFVPHRAFDGRPERDVLHIQAARPRPAAGRSWTSAPRSAKRAALPFAGPPEPDTWESIEQAAPTPLSRERVPRASTTTAGSSRTVSGGAPTAPWCGRGIRASRSAAPRRDVDWWSPPALDHAADAGAARRGEPRARPRHRRADGEGAASRQIHRDPARGPHAARGQPGGRSRCPEGLPRLRLRRPRPSLKTGSADGRPPRSARRRALPSRSPQPAQEPFDPLPRTDLRDVRSERRALDVEGVADIEPRVRLERPPRSEPP